MNIREVIEKDLIEFKNKDYIFQKVDGEYAPIKFNDFIYKSKCLASYLIDKGLKDKKILVIGVNSINIMIADIAATIYAGVCVNIAADTSSEDLEEAVTDIDIAAILYTSEQSDKIAELNVDIEKVNLNEVIPSLNYCGEEFKEYNSETCSKIVFSSGSTSKPKGVMLSLKNIFAGWNSLQRRTKFGIDDVIYLFLPLNHTYANIYNFYYSLLSGLSIYLCSDTKKIGEELREVNPTIFCAVPLIYERIAEAYSNNVEGAFGDRIRFLYTGGAPISSELKQVYKNAGLEVLGSYALSETASSFSIDYPGDTDENDVGVIFEDIEAKILDANEEGVGEIAAKGDCIFLGYTMDIPNCFTEDGFFRTGDLGYIKNKKLFITGRKKKVLIGSNGENIYIEDIVAKIKEMDANVNHVRLHLKGNKLCALFYLADVEKTDVDSLVRNYNDASSKKNQIAEYKVSNRKSFTKLVA